MKIGVVPLAILPCLSVAAFGQTPAITAVQNAAYFSAGLCPGAVEVNMAGDSDTATVSIQPRAQ
jgi:hypothetical protein